MTGPSWSGEFLADLENYSLNSLSQSRDKMIEIQPDMVFRRVAGVETNAAPDGVMVYQESRDKVHFLNQTAVIVFELCGME